MNLEERTDPMEPRCIIDVRPKDECRRYGEPNPHFGVVQVDDLTIEFLCDAQECSRVTADGYDIEPRLAGFPSERAHEMLKEARICLHKGKLKVIPGQAKVTVSGGPFTYDGNAHEAAVTVTGVRGEDISGDGTIDLVYVPTNPTDAGTYSVTATFTPKPGSNYDTASGSGSITIQPAQPTLTVTGGTFTYDGNAHGATAMVAGVKGEDLSNGGKISFGYTENGAAVTGTIDAGTYHVTATFIPNPGSNYGQAKNSSWITINPAQPTVTVNGGPVVYDGKPHSAKAYVTAAGKDISKSGVLTFAYNAIPAGSPVAVPCKPGMYAAMASFTSNSNYSPAYGSGLMTISPPVPVDGGGRTVVELQKAITGVNDELTALKPVTLPALRQLSHAVSDVIRDIELHKRAPETMPPDDFYRVTGKVVTKQNEAVPHILVQMQNSRTKEIEQAYTDGNGMYDFLLREGSYLFSAAGKSTTISVPAGDS